MWVNMNTDLDPATEGKVLALWSVEAGRKTITALYFGFTADKTADEPINTVVHYVREPDFSGTLVQAVKGYDINPENGQGTLGAALLVGCNGLRRRGGAEAGGGRRRPASGLDP